MFSDHKGTVKTSCDDNKNYDLKLQAMTGNQTSCSTRPLRKQLHCTLPSLFLLQLTFYFVFLLFSLLRPIYTRDSHQDEMVAGKVVAV